VPRSNNLLNNLNKMTKEKEKKVNYVYVDKKWHKHPNGFMGGGFYGLAFIGAAVYYVQQSSGFWPGVLGVLKALVWPAMLIYKVFTMLKM
jgi:hypothetical protein